MIRTGISPKKALPILCLIGWMGLIFLFSADSSSGEHSGSIFHGLCALLGIPPTPLLHFWFRKAAHFTEYAVLWGLWQWNLGRPGLSFLLAVLYAGTDEWHQAFVPTRGPSLRDVGVDALGALFALFMGRFVPLRACRRSRPVTRVGLPTRD